MDPKRRNFVIIVHAAFVVIGILAGLFIHPFPVQGSAEAVGVDALFGLMLAIAVIIFLTVEFWIVYSVWHYRAKPGDMGDGPNIHGNNALEITWTAIPAVIVFVLSIYSFQLFADLRTPKDGEIPIQVVGQQFKWSFQYDLPPDNDPNLTDDLKAKIKNFMISAELHVPVGKPVRTDITALDVMHGFYIPEFRIKQDAIPGRTTQAYFTASQKGDYWVECSELCGQNHSAMSLINRVYAEDQADYDKFIDGLYTKAKAAATDPTSPEVGKQLIVNKYPCGTCHYLDDAGLKGNIGPNLNGVATRAQQHADKQEAIIGDINAADYIRTSIVNPNYYIVPGFQPNVMPQIWGDVNNMPKQDLDAIVNYLMTQK